MLDTLLTNEVDIDLRPLELYQEQLKAVKETVNTDLMDHAGIVYLEERIRNYFDSLEFVFHLGNR
ncbi:hypothetical protein [Natrinema sp. SYSU A 869]|uniref:hypothetical protein n=1 Tax=Natrinema sp. SYSU A 869 TaxID=2871694 RepID=UPI001CA3A0BE|nr:hypothetical protein [Natrinema sp. SYSU A 869]